MVGLVSPIVGTSKLLRRELGGERIDMIMVVVCCCPGIGS
jgi:hypothetical protein